jgi:prevent-host-death family protein
VCFKDLLTFGRYIPAETPPPQPKRLKIAPTHAILQFIRFVRNGQKMITVTVSQARENFSDLLGKVQHGRNDVTIERHGKPVAVMISVEAMAYYEALEDAELGKMVADIYADPNYDPNDTVSHEEFFAQLRLEDAAE